MKNSSLNFFAFCESPDLALSSSYAKLFNGLIESFNIHLYMYKCLYWISIPYSVQIKLTPNISALIKIKILKSSLLILILGTVEK